MTLRSFLFLAAFFTAFAQADVLHEGPWTKKSYKISGSFRIEQAEDGTRTLHLSEDFKTRNAPDLKLVLNPKPLSELKNKNAMDNAVVLSPLTSNKGAQSYVIPKDVDLSAFQSLLIHCQKFTKLWGGAPLSQ